MFCARHFCCQASLWDNWGNTTLGITAGYQGGSALVSRNRAASSHGPAQSVNLDCMKGKEPIIYLHVSQSLYYFLIISYFRCFCISSFTLYVGRG